MNTRKAIDELLNKNEMFTAYDVTVHLRNSGEHVEHHDIKSEVHDLYAVGQLTDISRTVITIPGTHHKAYLYYNSDLDNDDLLAYSSIIPTYTSKTNSAKTNSTKTNSVNTTRNIRNRQPRNGLLEGAKADAKGCLNIPSSMVREMFSEYNYNVDAYKVDYTVDKIIVSAHLYGKTPMLGSTNTRDRIRINIKPLGKNEFRIEMVDGDIVIT
jgi:hypothetical protein